MNYQQKQEYLDKYVFHGLTNLNDGFDSMSIKYFDKVDFEVVLDRVEALSLKVYGIEPWKNGEYFDVKTFEHYSFDPQDPLWYRTAFQEFIATDEDLMYAASYQVPENKYESY